MGLLDLIQGSPQGDMGLLGSVLSRVDAMKRRGKGLLSLDAINQLGSAVAEDVRANAALAGQGYQNAGSVMPEVAQQGLQEMYQAGSPAALGLMTVYHGSPHVFDKFDMSKIGTGEGAQAYGHGLYFADNPSVAKTYAGAPFTVDGMTWNEIKNRWNHDLPWDRGMKRGINALADAQGDVAAAVAKLRSTGFPQSIDAANTLQSMASAGRIKPVSTNLYKVDIPDEVIGRMLQWDKPLSEQPRAVTDLVRQRLKDDGYLGPNDNGPRQLNNAIRAWRMEHGGMSDSPMEALVSGRGGLLGATPEQVSTNLNAAGIPGIRYLDQGSRTTGHGTYNTVLFDADLAKILGRE